MFGVTWTVFFTWESPPQSLLKVNYNDTNKDHRGGVGFMIRSPNLEFVKARGSMVVDITVPKVELRVA